MVLGIAGVFAFGIVACAAKLWRVSTELNDLREGRPAPRSRAAAYLERAAGLGPESRGMLVELLRLRLAAWISVVRHTANALVFLGLIGTVVGFIIALSGVDPGASGDVERIAPMVATLVEGMSVALYTTLAGGVLHLWLMINHRMLATGTMRLYSAIVERGERTGAAAGAPGADGARE
jgi:hypothetical protein